MVKFLELSIEDPTELTEVLRPLFFLSLCMTGMLRWALVPLTGSRLLKSSLEISKTSGGCSWVVLRFSIFLAMLV